ncbi:unnamed protein product (macronuclear) [Paramecium tetraurelia]|uniref:Uncharacterized protein n=1 Tax=Paramecium tetraurelia TaxID=5888 RepID=A0EET3_PARTE|nr:uncharacterized protein GSPATT00026147001 [Paramecium tetraurelia]CAK93824.1 unnamed protein product [Paramecium tetraurelia]|eukprot:XP_001461197.1 hypothetical protein (macronuclear) [Paramecium tetraurelia strain d4-2]
MNTIIEIKPMKVYKSLTFIRQLAQYYYQYTYLESIQEEILLITRFQENSLSLFEEQEIL